MRRHLAISRRLTPRRASIAASPVLVGAITVITVIVAVYLAWNANNRLPFVPTYELNAELPSGANLVPGNDVRAGGFRVGVIDNLTTQQVGAPGQTHEVAIAHLKLDKVVQPLAVDTRVLVRPRSTLGLKYLQLTPGTSPRTFAAGQTIPLAQSDQPVEFDDFLNTFDQPTRQAEQQALVGFGDALAGRGESINQAISGLVPFLGHLTPVMQNLNSPQTGLEQFFSQMGKTAAEVAPVSRTQADLFVKMDQTFAAFAHNPRALADIPRKSPATEDVSIQSFRVQRPFLADFTDLSNRLRPAAQELPRSLPIINVALAEGTPVLRNSVALNQRTGDFLSALNDLARNPATLPGLQNLTQFATVTNPFVNFVAPYQTVCNNFNYFFYPLGEHQSESTGSGTAERTLNIGGNNTQPNVLSQSSASRPVDVPEGQDPKTATDPTGQPLEARHAQGYQPAIDANGNADCQTGQNGYLNRLDTGGRYPPSPDPNQGGGNHVVYDPNTPGNAGPTFTGVPSLRNVP